MRGFGFGVLLWALLAGGAGAAEHALKGVALVIGETNYVRLASLANPDRDARDIDHMLDDLGFEVTRVLDVRTEQLRSRIAGFLDDAKGADVALVYYAGHGIEAGGTNYIMGTDANIADPESASATLLPLDDMLAQLEQSVPITIVLLDACRTNPFTGQQTVELAGVASVLTIGEAGLEPLRGPTPLAGTDAKKASSLGVVVGFSASPGQSALDGPVGENSPYASALLQHLSAGGYSFGDIMTLVSQEVYVDTGARQLPWTNSSLRKVLYFGREAAEPAGEEAAILGDRRKLLLDIASVPDQSKAYVEAIATQEDLKLADLYAMLAIIKGSKAKGGNDQDELLDVARRVREVLDDPILAGVPSDPELARLDALANKAIAAGAFKLAFKYRQQQAARAGKIEKTLDAQQADIDTQRKQLAAVYARVAESAMYTLDSKAETEAYKRAAGQTDLFDKSLSIRLRLRAANAQADKALHGGMDEHAGLVAIALYTDILKDIDKAASPTLWAEVQLRMGETMWETSNRRSDDELNRSSIDAARAALTVFTLAKDRHRWSRAEQLLGQALRHDGQTLEAMEVLTGLIDAVPKAVSPIDWARSQEYLGELLYDLGYHRSDTDTELLTRAIAAYDAAASGYRRYAPDAYTNALQRVADVQARLGLRTKDVALLRRGIEGGRQALKRLSNPKSLQWGNQSRMLGEDLVAAGIFFDDAAMIKEGLAVLAKSGKVLTVKTQEVDWAHIREAEGDGLAFLGSKAPQSKKQLNAAIAAYNDSADAFEEIGHWDTGRLRIKSIKLRALLGQKLKPNELALINLPPPAALDVSSAKALVGNGDTNPQFEGFNITIFGAKTESRPWSFQFFLMSDYNSDDRVPSNLDLLRIAIHTDGFVDKRSREANYSKCGNLVTQPGQVNLHYGKQGFLNSCVFAAMAPADAALWQAVWAAFPGLIEKAAAAGDKAAAHLVPLFAIKPPTIQ